jgi:outer membrane receptor for monomeric catechols
MNPSCIEQGRNLSGMYTRKADCVAFFILSHCIQIEEEARQKAEEKKAELQAKAKAAADEVERIQLQAAAQAGMSAPLARTL